MNSTIKFSNPVIFVIANNALALFDTPEYFSDATDLSITSGNIDPIINLLVSNGIENFEMDVTDEEKDMHDDAVIMPGEDMDGDFDSGMASAGFGTDEDYGCYGGNDE